MVDPQSRLTHFDTAGDARMVDVGAKASTERTARARGWIALSPDAMSAIESGAAGKGDVLGVARVAAIMAAKRTADLIPLCHAIALTSIRVGFDLERPAGRVVCTVSAQTVAQTGVEMEALMAVQVALLTIYDMCKAIDRGMVIGEVRLLEKRGGASGDWSAAA